MRELLDERSARHQRAEASSAVPRVDGVAYEGQARGAGLTRERDRGAGPGLVETQSPGAGSVLGPGPALAKATLLAGSEGVAVSEGGPVGEAEGPTAVRRAIMIVDDDDAIREALEDVLSDEGYEVVGMSDGQQALDYLRVEKRPSAILVDLWMPVMDGWKFLDALLEDPRFSRIPLVVLTAARDQRARDLRVSEVLTKPVQLQQVLGTLERLTKVS
jgi:CheY-like chemotaxis protein